MDESLTLFFYHILNKQNRKLNNSKEHIFIIQLYNVIFKHNHII